MTRTEKGERNDVARWSAKRILIRLLLVDRVQTKWAKSLLGAITTTLIISLLTLGVTTLYQNVTQILSEAKNISEEQALAVAKQNVGADTVGAIPFRNRDSDLQYIAVSTKAPKSVVVRQVKTQVITPPPYVWEIHLLEGKDGNYWAPQATSTMMAYDTLYMSLHVFDHQRPYDPQVAWKAYRSEEYQKAVFGVVDIDTDGNKEVYSVLRVSGSGGYGFSLYVYDSLSHESFWLKAGGEFTSPILDYHYSPNAAQDSQIYAWMNRKAEELTLKSEGRYEDAVNEWLQTNGRGMYEGEVNIRAFPGNLPQSGNGVACSLNDGSTRWVSSWQGAVFGYEESKHIYYVAYVPYGAYDWVGSMVAGKRYLWMGVGTPNGILAFDKETHALKIIPVPEISSSDMMLPSDEGGRTHPRRFWSNLRVSDSSLYLGHDHLDLPDSIDAQEFENAAVCGGF